jgi:hypothetical protein
MPSHYGSEKSMPMKTTEKKMTMKMALEKFAKMKKIPEPMMKPVTRLSKTQSTLMKEHADHHTKLHMDLMKKMMKMGYCFQQAHDLTMKLVGK